jgi:hypothetical protein
MNLRLPAAVLASLVLVLPLAGGCAKSCVDQLRDQSVLVERRLTSERDSAVAQGAAGSAKISHLTTLRTALSVANISLAAVPVVLPEAPQRDVAYSVLDEVYKTIDWNIPIVDRGGQRSLPVLFDPASGLNFGAIRGTAEPSPTRPPGFAN